MVKKPITPRSQIISAIRRLWLRSRERAEVCKRQKYTCQHCGAKQSKAKGREVKIEVHHMDGIDWKGIAEIIRGRVLSRPERLEVLCKPCHKAEHERKK